MANETQQHTNGGVAYDVDRHQQRLNRLYQLRRPGSAEPLARINYHGADAPMDVCTYGQALPVTAVE